jgi:hypothetical protein
MIESVAHRYHLSSQELLIGVIHHRCQLALQLGIHLLPLLQLQTGKLRLLTSSKSLSA